MGASVRFEDWPARLSALVASRQDAPFAWGTHDCCLFAADVVLELTGVDAAADLRGAYSTAVEASRVVKGLGGVRGIAGAVLGAEILPLMAQRGDIVLLQTEAHGDTLAVCLGTHCVAPGVDHLERWPLAQAVTAWRVR